MIQVDDDDEESYSNDDEDPFHGDMALAPSREKIRMNRRPKSITRDLRNRINERALQEMMDEEEVDLSDDDFQESDRIAIIS